ncbi:hypothetical protein NUACC21_28250 [Scytonema sp. NUACC21]
MTNTPEPPSSRLDRLEAILTDTAEIVLAHNDALTRIEGAIAKLTTTTERLAAEAAEDRQQAAIDRQSFQTEIQRIWEYLLRQGGNGSNPSRG